MTSTDERLRDCAQLLKEVLIQRSKKVNTVHDIVNVNTAGKRDLMKHLIGIGGHKADKLIEMRFSQGSFTHKDDLLKVDGISSEITDLHAGKTSRWNRISAVVNTHHTRSYG